MKTAALLLSLVLVGANSTEVTENEPVPISTQATECYFEGIEFQLFGQYAGYNILDNSLKIYPYFNLDRHITVEKLFLSDRPFWDTIANPDTREDYDGYSIFSVENSTYGYIPINADYAFFLYTDTLPSGYVKEVLKRICLPST